MLGLLAASYALNLLDRQIINIVAEPIKQDLSLTDTQLGMVTGLSFALLYSVMALPIARAADRGNRVRIVGWAILVWSIFTAACGAAGSFIQLLLLRIGVGVGEAGCAPPAQSLIADEFPLEKRSGALAIFALGSPVGAALGLAAGGLLVSSIGWRWTIVMAGLPGVVVGVLVLKTLRDPARQAFAAAPPRLGLVLKRLLLRRQLVFAMLGCGLLSFMNYGAMAFATSFYLRNHGLQLHDMGAALSLPPIAVIGFGLGILGGTGGALGALAGGYLGNRLAMRDMRWLVFIPAIGSLLCSLGYWAMFAVADARVSLGLFFFAGFCSVLWAGPGTLAMQRLAEAPARASALAINLFFNSVIGLGLGPLFVGIASDWMAPGLGEGPGLRAALLLAPVAGILSTLAFAASAIGMRDAVAAAETGEMT
ncbi:MFS transporter [Sphingobium jiangsuense]|uniref:Putative MFS family arabinose efflux permease n=1 Tax=Sphingobium jiangsuense TaxID=870476 RepID=A0A7W6BH32_9SPHN|nr:MFS transporter [Sphingobium jiangsuense]MBB3926866.1 putative MFS family arabinose efflux permease [Sphingobium jiangsuense]GLS98874.1 MFS transporter [Sphingobium jiangsuense]